MSSAPECSIGFLNRLARANEQADGSACHEPANDRSRLHPGGYIVMGSRSNHTFILLVLFALLLFPLALAGCFGHDNPTTPETPAPIATW